MPTRRPPEYQRQAVLRIARLLVAAGQPPSLRRIARYLPLTPQAIAHHRRALKSRGQWLWPDPPCSRFGELSQSADAIRLRDRRRTLKIRLSLSLREAR